MRLILTALLLIASLLSWGQRTNQAYWTYIDKYKDWAIEQMRDYHIPASITLAQGLLESNAGRSTLATKANNHFGIKARGLKAAGYATSPTYADALIRVIEMYNLNQFDKGKSRSSVKNATATAHINDFFQKHSVYQGNKNQYIIVEVGDDMATISKATGLSLRKLYKYNDLPRDYAPTAGDIIYLKKKRSCASREFRKNPIHIVEVNQSLFDIAQLYGIRLESLCKLNKWDEPHAVEVGEILRIR